MTAFAQPDYQSAGRTLVDDYQRIRRHTEQICAPLEIEDYGIQTMPDVSPAKWHLAHTSWFFETFILLPFLNKYRCFDSHYDHLFNSYYLTHGQPFSRPSRGLLSRPTVNRVYSYRAAVDEAVQSLLANATETRGSQIEQLVILGLNHEQQHQELMLTDLKHVFAQNPMRPRYRELALPPSRPSPEISWRTVDDGVYQVGQHGDAFGYDNEYPRHKVLLKAFALATRPVTNAEYIAFIEDGGYREPGLWLSDGWTTLQSNTWQAPLYWERHDNEWWHMTLGGMRPVDLHAPVCHVSQYEAAAFAGWAGKRLPTEYEWEVSAANMPVEGNLRDTGYLQPAAAKASAGLQQCFGDVWEWTASAYAPYPGYRTAAGSIGEYNGKFMSSQAVLRGGSCVTPADHIRASYRNFFYPKDRWQFSGIRLAQDL